MAEENLIKIRIPHNEAENKPAESIWAEQLTPDTAKVKNIPFYHNHVSLHDIVRFNDEHDIVEVVEQKTQGYVVEYEYEEETLQETWKSFYNYFEKENEIPVEGAFAGIASIAVPIDMSDEELDKLMEECPVNGALYSR